MNIEGDVPLPAKPHVSSILIASATRDRVTLKAQ